MKEALTFRLDTNMKENYRTVCEANNETMTQNLVNHIRQHTQQKADDLLETHDKLNQIRNEFRF